MIHLSTMQLLAVRDGRSVDRELLVHLVSCSECQAAFDDTRWILALRRAREAVVAGEHLTDDEITAFVERALPDDRMKRMRAHVRDCDRCMAYYGRQRTINRRDSYSSPSAVAVASTLKTFRPNPIRRLGVLLLKRLGQGVEIVFQPTRAMWADGTAATLGPPGVEQAPRVERPSARRRRLGARLSRLVPERRVREADDELLSAEDAAVYDHGMPKREAAAPAAGSAAIDAGPWRLVLTGDRGPDGPRVNIGIFDGESGSAVPGVPLRLKSGKRTIARVTTGDDGHAELSPVPDGAEIIVGDAPGFRLAVRDLG